MRSTRHPLSPETAVSFLTGRTSRIYFIELPAMLISFLERTQNSPSSCQQSLMVINLRTAKALGLTVPPSHRRRGDRIGDQSRLMARCVISHLATIRPQLEHKPTWRGHRECAASTSSLRPASRSGSLSIGSDPPDRQSLARPFTWSTEVRGSRCWSRAKHREGHEHG
jgi:hypothetical protein